MMITMMTTTTTTVQVLDRVFRISPLVLRVIRYVFGVVLVTHLLACVFWLLKVREPFRLSPSSPECQDDQPAACSCCCVRNILPALCVCVCVRALARECVTRH